MRLRPSSRRSFGLATALLLAMAATIAHAGDPVPAPAPTVAAETLTLVEEVNYDLEGGRHAAALERLDPAACTALSAAPTAAYDIVVMVVRTLPAALKSDPKAASALVERLRSLVGAEDRSPHAAGMRAIGDLARSITGRLHAASTPVADARTAIATLKKLETKLPGLDRVFADTFAIAQFVASVRPADADVWAVLLAAADPLRKARADDEAFANTIASAELEWGTLAPASEAAAVRPALERSLATFAAHGWAEQVKDGRWTEDTRLFNRALSAAKNLGSATKIPYVSSVFKSRTGALTANVPAYSGWTWSYGDSNQDNGKLVRKTAEGGEIEIQIWGYNGSTEYTMADGSVIPGENIDGFLKKHVKDDRDSLTKISRDIRTTGPLSATIKESRGYDLKGLSILGVPTRYRSWYFKYSIYLKRYFNVSLTQTGNYSEKDPELLFLLDSIEEQVEER